MRRALAWAAALLLSGAAVEFAAGFLRFAGSLPRAPDPGLAEVEAVAVLTGGSGRIRAGLDALAAAPGAVLFVSGVHEATDAERLIARLGRDPAPLRGRVVLGRAAADTRGNADETARWMAERGFSRLALITSAYHMPRAEAEFRRAMPDAALVRLPVVTGNVKLDAWWRHWGAARLLAGEYAKYRLARLRP